MMRYAAKVIVFLMLLSSSTWASTCVTLSGKQLEEMVTKILARPDQIVVMVAVCQQQPALSLASFFTRLHPQQHIHSVPTGVLSPYQKHQEGKGAHQITGFVALTSVPDTFELRLRVRENSERFQDISHTFVVSKNASYQVQSEGWLVTIQRVN